MKLARKIFSAAAMALAFSAMGASAATVSFTPFSSTNSYQLSPTFTVSDDTPGQFDVSTSISSPDVGSLVGVYMDLSTSIVEDDITDGSFSLINFVGGGGVLNLGGGVNMTGDGTAGFDFGIRYNKDDQIGIVPLTFSISDLGGTLALSDITRVGLRFQESNNNASQTGAGESDKLVSSTYILVGGGGGGTGPMLPVPLPAGLPLILSGLGVFGFLRLRSRKSA